MSNLIVPRMRIGDIYQIGIVVRDVRKAVEHYWATLGVGPWKIYRVGPPNLSDVTVRGKPIVLPFMVGAFAQSGPLQLELMEPSEGPSIHREFLEKRGEGLHHVQCRVEDPDAVLSAFKEMGVDVLTSGMIGDNWFYYMDTEPLLGIIIEFMKRGTALATSSFTLEGTYPP